MSLLFTALTMIGFHLFELYYLYTSHYRFFLYNLQYFDEIYKYC